MAKYLAVPYPVVLRNLVTDEPVGRDLSFYEFVQGTLLVDKRFGKSVKELQTALRIGQAIKGAVAGQIISIESADWELLREVAKEPDGGYQPGVAVQLLCFIEAITERAADAHPGNAKGPRTDLQSSSVVVP